MPIIITIVGGLAIVYLGTKVIATFAIALLGISLAGIASLVAYRLFINTRNNCDLFNFKKCR